MTCVITLFSITRGTLTLVFFCLGFLQVHYWQWKYGGRYSYGTKYICIISKQQRLSQARDIKKIVCVNDEQKWPKDWSLWHARWKFSYSKIDGTWTGQIESYSQDNFWSSTKLCPELCVPSLWHNILQLMVSNTLDRSKIMPKVDSFLAIAEGMLLIKSIKAGAIQSVCWTWLSQNI